MVILEQHLHPDSKEELVVHLPETALHQDVKVSVEVVEKPAVAPLTESERQARLNKLFEFLDSLKIDTRGWKFDRDEANER